MRVRVVCMELAHARRLLALRTQRSREEKEDEEGKGRETTNVAIASCVDVSCLVHIAGPRTYQLRA